MKQEDILTDINYLYKAFKKSQNRRSYTISSVAFEEKVFGNLLQIQKEIQEKTYKVAGYTEFEVSIPKKRRIKACKFRDKIVQHVLCDNILVPKLPEICITDNYAGQRGKGTGMARERLIEKMKAFLNLQMVRQDISIAEISINTITALPMTKRRILWSIISRSLPTG